MTPAQAIPLYNRYFLFETGICQLPEALIETVLDFAVNARPVVAIRELRRVLNGFVRRPDSGLISRVEDGTIGPRTLGTAAQVLGVYGERLIDAYAKAHCAFYARRVCAPRQSRLYQRLARARVSITSGALDHE